MTYPVTQTHMAIPEEVCKSYGLSNRLLQVSISIEHVDDIIADLEQAFNNV